MDILLRDARYALRLLRRSPLFTLVASLAVALGAAAVTAVYSVAEAVLLRPSPAIGAPDRLVTVSKADAAGRGRWPVSYLAYRHLRDRTRTLAGLAAFRERRVELGGETGGAASVPAVVVSGDYFDVLRVRPALGRFFAPDEDRTPMARPVAVLGFRYWKERFNGDPGILGRTVRVNGAPFTVVGVAPDGFDGTVALVTTSVYLPVMMEGALSPDGAATLANREADWLMLVGRLGAAGREAAEAELTRLAAASMTEHGIHPDVSMRLARLRGVPASGVAPVTLFLSAMFALAVLVLALAAVNVASMQLARGVARRREFVARLALGAGRGRLVRQLVTESVLLFALGGALGAALAWGLVRVVARLPLDLPVPMRLDFPIDAPVLAVTLGVSLAVGVLFGLVPALHATRHDLAGLLRADAAGAGGRRERTRARFVVGQLAVSALLLVAAGLFLQAFRRGHDVSPGYELRRVVALSVPMSGAGMAGARAADAQAALRERALQLPGVEGAAWTDLVPLGGRMMMTEVGLPGWNARERGPAVASLLHVGPGFLAALGLPLLRGRDLDARDGAGAAVVTAGFARDYFRDGDALGRTFTIGDQAYTVVGVAADGRFAAITDDPQPYAFLRASGADPDRTLLVRTRGDPAGAEAALLRLARESSPGASAQVRGLASIAAAGLVPQRVAAQVTAAMGLAGLLLASLGLYGVIAFGVGQRSRELGVRMALGLAPRGVERMVVGEGLRLTAAGLAIGMLLSLGLARLLARVLFGVSPTDPATLLGVPALLGTASVLATWVPARRAARADLARALRAD